MVNDYKLSVRFLAGKSWSGDTILQDIFVQANMPNLGILLHTLDASDSVVGIAVFRTFVLPELTTLSKMTREDLHIQNNEMMKVS